MDWEQFKSSLANYIADMHDATLEDFEVVAGKGRIFVIDAHKNDLVWEFEYLGEANYPAEYHIAHQNPPLIRMDAWVDHSLYQCVIPAYPWLVGAVIFS